MLEGEKEWLQRRSHCVEGKVVSRIEEGCHLISDINATGIRVDRVMT